ncbi:hypothetical protein M407DRAFT_244172 [Tulasnella calospora MUT 4182]|uniref:Uncharacterized protein n=1 Tax=Tulasnella calospora MUT 4182 TaxID=1051891 RepID=A0A0C3LUT1_9AGAM|nr:hypothetical protein M407DRAFT_244172 [Tulasnella calospora MUT 4182]
MQRKVDELEIAIELQGAKVIRSRREITSLKKDLQDLQAAYRAKAIELDQRLESLRSAEEERVIVVERALDYAEGLESIVMDILGKDPAQHAEARRRLRGLRARLSQPILPGRRTPWLRACVMSWNNFLASIHTPDVFVCVTLAIFVAGYLMIWPEAFTLGAS